MARPLTSYIGKRLLLLIPTLLGVSVLTFLLIHLIPGDLVTIRTQLLEFKEKSVRFMHEMTNEETGVVVARTTLKGVHLDTEARKSCAFPEAVRERAMRMLGPGTQEPR